MYTKLELLQGQYPFNHSLHITQSCTDSCGQMKAGRSPEKRSHHISASNLAGRPMLIFEGEYLTLHFLLHASFPPLHAPE